MKKFAVFGDPINQSISPQIHQAFAKQAGLEIQYSRIQANQADFPRKLTAFFADSDAVGCNVTAPLKEVAFSLIRHTQPSASMAEAVNTIYLADDNSWVGENTDGLGLVTDLTRLNGALAGKRILLIGAGGAARGVIHPLLDAGIARLCITNRTSIKAQLITDKAGSSKVMAIPFVNLPTDFDIIINATSAGLHGQEMPLPMDLVAEGTFVYDMVYKPDDTPFVVEAKKKGAQHTSDGFGMLVGQAAAAFHIWTGFKPNIAPVIQSLRPTVFSQK